jgi:hypothetical protein
MRSVSEVKVVVKLPRTGLEIELDLKELEILRQDLQELLPKLGNGEPEPEPKPIPKAKPKKVECPRCGKTFADRRGLSGHSRKHYVEDRKKLEQLNAQTV